MKNCFFTVIAIFGLLFASVPVAAEMTVVEDADGQDGLTVYKMVVTPAPEPRPALRHRLTLRPEERKPGNAATHYLRSYGENSLSAPWQRIRGKFGSEVVDSWHRPQVPIKDVPLDRLREAAGAFDSYVENHIAPASKCRDCDWGLAEEDLYGPETISFMLPDAQQSREISRALGIRTRLAIAEGRYDDAIEHMRMNYQLGQDIAKQRFLVCSLIGIAEVGVANDTLLELIAAPDSPNMYWALTELPRPVIDMREAVRLEMSLGLRVSPVLMDIENAEHSPQEWARLLAQSFKVFQDIGEIEGFAGFNSGVNSGPMQNLVRSFMATGYSLAAYPAAKQRLIALGTSAAAVEAMPVGQVMLLDAAREYRRVADEYEKWWYIDFSQARSRMHEIDGELGGSMWEGGYGRVIARMLLPAVYAARNAQIRTEWQLDALRIIEAIRMHAAERGELPRSLTEITVVPLPLNPITREPFRYRLDGKMAILELPFSDGMPGQSRRFEITLAN